MYKRNKYWILVIIAVGLTGCVTSGPPPNPDQAKVVGAERVFLAVATDSPDINIKFVKMLLLPQGGTTLVVRTEDTSLGLIPTMIADSQEKKKIRRCAIELKGGHEYRAQIEYNGWHAYWNRPIIITDVTTGEQVARLVVPDSGLE